jgi:hypothetical protein
MIANNQFSNDTVDVRLLRLQRIEANIAAHTAALALDASAADWGAGAFDAMKTARLQISLALGDAKAKTYLHNQALDEARAAYQIAKIYADAKYDQHRERIDSMHFDLPYPEEQGEQLRRVEHVVENHAEWVADGLTPLFKPALITRLQNAYAAAAAAQAASVAADRHLERKRDAYKQLFREDGDRLRDLYADAVSGWDPDHINLGDLGFARKSQMGEGGGGAVPPVPNVTYDEATETLLWDGDEFDTSSDVQSTDDNGATVSDVLIAADVHEAAIARLAVEQKARVRSRNANGTSAWSAWVTIMAAFLAPPGAFGYVIAQGKFTWVLVAGATLYRMEASFDGGGTWNEIFGGAFAVGEYVWTPPSGTHHFRIRCEGGGLTSAWVEIVVTIP